MVLRARQLEGLGKEFTGVELGDARLEARAVRIVERIASAPGESFPKQMASTAEREGLYRFFANDSITLDALMRPHVRQTHERMRAHGVVRIAHDTTEFAFEGDREGLGILSRKTKGFYAHMALAVSGDEIREPLGVLAVRPHVLAGVESRRGLTPSQRVKVSNAKPRSEKLSSRWECVAKEVEEALPEGVNAIHVMDQEADDFALLAALHDAELHFVVRGSADRRIDEGGTIADAMAAAPVHGFRGVLVNRRSEKIATRRHPRRSERVASLRIQWTTVTLRRSAIAQTDVDVLRVQVVHVFEPETPLGEEAIEWTLLTSEPITDLASATAIVDHYRARWVIEEYFKALKTGCAFEKRQLTTLDALLRALGLFVPAAWRLLTLRTLGRTSPDRPASALFDAEQLLLLAALLQTRKQALPAAPTVRDAMLAIAALGGHIKNNGDPGWMVLGRGYVSFLEAEAVWKLARRTDQS